MLFFFFNKILLYYTRRVALIYQYYNIITVAVQLKENTILILYKYYTLTGRIHLSVIQLNTENTNQRQASSIYNNLFY